MKPRELYSGAAPTAMGQMGQGLAEVGANIARTTQQAYESAGRAIGQGLQAVGQAYADYKKMESESKAAEKMFNTLADENYLPKEVVAKIRAGAEEMKAASSLDRNAFWKEQKALLGGAVTQAHTLEQIKQQGINAVNANPAFSYLPQTKEELKARAVYYDALAKAAGVKAVGAPTEDPTYGLQKPKPIGSQSSSYVRPSTEAAPMMPTTVPDTGYQPVPPGTPISALGTPSAAIYGLQAPTPTSGGVLDQPVGLSLAPQPATQLIPGLSEQEKGDQIPWDSLYTWEQEALKEKFKSKKFGKQQWEMMHPETQRNNRAELK